MKTNLLGKILSKIQFERWHARQKAEDELWDRNGLGNPARRPGYKLEEHKTVGKEGTEVTTLRLWKLVDQSVLTISSEITSKVEIGINGGENDTPAQDNATDSPI